MDIKMLKEEDTLVVFTLEEHGMPLTDEGRQDTLDMIFESYPELNGKVTAFISGDTANDPASMAAMLRDAKNAVIVVGLTDPEPETVLVNRDIYGDVIRFLLAADEGETSWGILADVLDEDGQEA